MKASLALARLELYFGLRRSGFLIYYLLLAGLPFLMANAMGGAFANIQTSGDGLKFNAPFAVQTLMGIINLVTTFLVASLAGMGALRDYRYNSYGLTHSYPVSRPAFVLGRFLGVYATVLLLFTAPLLGFAIGCEMPWLNRALFLPFDLATYVDVFLQLFAVNLFFLTAGFFTLGLLFRNIVVNWVAIIGFYLLYVLGGNYFGEPGMRALGALLDPYGLTGIAVISVGQSAEEHNTQAVSLTGLYGWNRLLWGGLGVLSLIVGVWRFRFGVAGHRLRLRLFPAPPKAARSADAPTARPVVSKDFGAGYAFRTFGSQLRLEVGQLGRSVYLYLFLVVAVVFLYFSSTVLTSEFEGVSYPVTRRMAEVFGGVTNVFGLLLIAVFSGEMVWRDGQHRMAGIVYSMPASRPVRFLAKTVALCGVVLLLLLIVGGAGIVYQAAHGYYRFELPVYAGYLFGYLGLRYLFYIVLAVALQMLVGNKYQGYAAFGAVYLFGHFLAGNLFRHGIFQPGHMPSVSYSDLVGFNGSFYPFLVYFGYWMLIAVLLWRAGQRLLLVADGEGYRERWRRARKTGLQTRALTAGLLLALVALGVFIWYNTDVRNDNHTAKYLNGLAASYEQRYNRLRTVPQPRMTRIEGAVALYPAQKALQADLRLTLVNKTAAPVRTVYMNLPDDRDTRVTPVGRSWTVKTADKSLDFYGYALAQPLQPGDSLVLQYHFGSAPRGFTDGGVSALVRPNGTFLNSAAFLPVIGYDAGHELTGNNLRAAYGLGAKPYAPRLDDPLAKGDHFMGTGADRVWLDLTLSTEAGQTAIAPGYLQRQWTAGGRAFFRYKMDQPAVNFFSIQSGRYAVRTEAFSVLEDSQQRPVQLSVYYHPGHAYNTGVMMQALKDGLRYYTGAFGPYPYRQLRVIEFPESSFAQSFANTIAFSENIGFLTDLRGLKAPAEKPDETAVEEAPLNFPYFITLHEIAHQWWGHQILPAATEGAQFLSESLSQYSAVMAVRQRYGAIAARKLLEHYAFEYMAGRGGERLEERPLMRVLDQQYLCYAKGMCVLYSLQKHLGEAKVNAVLKGFLHDWAFREHPYVTADVLVGRLKAAAPDSLRYLVTDGLEKTVLYENRLRSATYRLDPETLEYTVDAVVQGRKWQYTPKGTASPAPMNDCVELGILNTAGSQVGSRIVRLHAGENRLRFTTSRRPASLVLNPDFDGPEKDIDPASRKVAVVKR